MVQMAISSTQIQAYMYQQNVQILLPEPSGDTEPRPVDRFELSADIATAGTAFRIVTERVMARIEVAVEQARELLGVGPGAPMDTSPEATAERIFNFATGFFDTYQAQHPELDDETAREQFVELVWDAVQQGIQEARDILTAIAPISESVNAGIDKIAYILENRFTQFLEGTGSESALGTVAPAWSPMTM